MCVTWKIVVWAIGFVILLVGSFNFVYLDHQSKNPTYVSSRDNEDYWYAFLISALWPMAVIFAIIMGIVTVVGKLVIYVLTIPARLYKMRNQK